MTSAPLSFKRATYKAVRQFVRSACRLMPDKLAIMVHEGTGLVRRLDYDDRPILLHAESEVELRVRLRSVAKEPEMLPWLRAALKPGDTFYDIGANVGAYTLLAAAVHEGHVEVISFEPAATNYAQLCRNLALNPWATCITPLPIALGQTRRLLPFGYSDLTAGAALHATGQAADGVEQCYVQSVMSMSLDELIAEYGLRKPNVVKIDVDGEELPLLRGARQTLCDSSVRSVLIELEDGTSDGAIVKELLASWGYREVSRGEWVVGPRRGLQVRNANHIYERVSGRIPVPPLSVQ